MALITWHSNFTVNVVEIDRQHNKLLNIISDLDRNLQLKKTKDVISKNLDELLNYTVYHFSYEEKLLLEQNFPESNMHIRSHSQLIESLRMYIKEFENGNSLSTSELLNLLQGWFENHVAGADRNFSAF